MTLKRHNFSLMPVCWHIATLYTFYDALYYLKQLDIGHHKMQHI